MPRVCLIATCPYIVCLIVSNIPYFTFDIVMAMKYSGIPTTTLNTGSVTKQIDGDLYQGLTSCQLSVTLMTKLTTK